MELMPGWCLPHVDTLQSHAASPSAGFSARQRKQELERLNEQLRKINMGLRQQARAGTVYAPGLTYAPPPSDQAQVRLHMQHLSCADGALFSFKWSIFVQCLSCTQHWIPVGLTEPCKTC